MGNPGAEKRAIQQRKESIDNYYKSPYYCKLCNKIIEVDHQTVSAIKRKKFCNRSCAAIYNNSKRILIPIKKTKRTASHVDNYINNQNSMIGNRTKKETFTYYKTYQTARSAIRRHAHRNFFFHCTDKRCQNCGYEKYIEVCHIKSVSDHEDSTLISTINDISNLIGLCPNCHWEFDHGLLKL